MSAINVKTNAITIQNLFIITKMQQIILKNRLLKKTTSTRNNQHVATRTDSKKQ